ncbi:MAG: GNAT family N-acetyltransferase [Pseudomonadota bacterium]
MAQLVWQDGALSLTVETRLSTAWQRYLAGIDFGAESQVYQRHRLDPAHYTDPLWFTLKDGTQQIGSYLLDRCKLKQGEQTIDGVYRGLLTVARSHRGRGLSGRISATALDWLTRQSTAPFLSYGCVDVDNLASQRMLARQGFIPLGHLGSWLDYRQRKPKPSPRCHDGLSESAHKAYTRQYGDAPLVHQHTDAQWTTLRNGDALVACRHHAAALHLKLGPVANVITRRMMPLIAAAQARFNPDDFRYVAINEPVASGSLEQVRPLYRELTAHLMHRYETHFASIALAEGCASDGAQAIRQCISRRKLLTRRQVTVLVKWHGINRQPEAPRALLLSAPDV